MPLLLPPRPPFPLLLSPLARLTPVEGAPPDSTQSKQSPLARHAQLACATYTTATPVHSGCPRPTSTNCPSGQYIETTATGTSCPWCTCIATSPATTTTAQCTTYSCGGWPSGQYATLTKPSSALCSSCTCDTYPTTMAACPTDSCTGCPSDQYQTQTKPPGASCSVCACATRTAVPMTTPSSAA